MRRTRGGFVVCGGCLRHVRLQAFDGSEDCPFCGTRIDVNAAGRAVQPAQAGAGRGAVVLAALLGVSAAACGTEEEPAGGDDTGVVEDVPGIDAMYGGPPLDASEDALVEEDVPAADAYGLPPDSAFEDVPVAPPYGIPAPDAASPDASTDEDIIPDPIPQPEYGLPFDPDAGTDDDIEEPIPAPEYGAPPDDEP
jgi:hypothetical protein